MTGSFSSRMPASTAAPDRRPSLRPEPSSPPARSIHSLQLATTFRRLTTGFVKRCNHVSLSCRSVENQEPSNRQSQPSWELVPARQ